jgi:uncharacterized protein
MHIVDTLKKLVKKTMEVSSQDWEHVARVYHLSTMIAEKEGADVDLCQVTALLHDNGKVIGEPHNLTGRGRAKVLLRGMSYPSQRIEHVLRIVENHSMDNWERLDSLEEKVVLDADKLDRLGAVGLARAFHMQGEAGLNLTDLTWFQEDIMLRYERLNTETAKEMGKKRIEFMEDFFKTLEEDVNFI